MIYRGKKLQLVGKKVRFFDIAVWNMKKILALTVHLFTSFGIVCGFLAILAINQQQWKIAMLWLLAALVIDGVDGTFARWLKVKETLPGIDGKSIDYVIDFANYALIPAYFLYQAQIVHESVNLFQLLPY